MPEASTRVPKAALRNRVRRVTLFVSSAWTFLFCELLGQEFERDVAMQLEVFGFVHHTHPAATELRENAIVRDDLANHP
jgi:hypothetical protein